MVITETERGTLRVHHESIDLETRECLQFIDLTDAVLDLVRRSRVRDGFANIQSLHTTAAIMVNEHEPLLLGDMKRLLEKLAPRGTTYQHDNFEVRTVNMCPEEEKNGHSHCKAMFLKTSETLNIVEGALQLGQWQRIFFIELDGAKSRKVSVVVIGQES